MLRNKDILTIVIPDLQKEEAVAIRDELREMKEKVAPKARANVAIGKRGMFTSIMENCIKAIEGEE